MPPAKTEPNPRNRPGPDEEPDVAEGPPEEIVKVAESYTGHYLARHLPRSAATKKRA